MESTYFNTKNKLIATKIYFYEDELLSAMTITQENINLGQCSFVLVLQAVTCELGRGTKLE